MINEMKYVYAIIENPHGERGGSPISLSRGVYSLGVTGINDRDVVLLPYRDLAAVVSNSCLIQFDRLKQEKLCEYVAVHERLNALLMDHYCVIPMRFGMMVKNEEEVLRVLEKAYLQFKAALTSVAGCAEFIVEVLWNEKQELCAITREDSTIQRLQKELASKGTVLGLAVKMKLGRRVFEALASRRKGYTQDIIRQLVSRFPRFSVGKLLDASQIQTTDKTEQEMIINYSFLIDKEEETALAATLDELAEQYDNLKFKYIGPMPPYSFVDINLSYGNFDVVNQARTVLELGESASLQDIKQAYHGLAAQYHPDKHEHKGNLAVLEETTKKMKEIVRANDILTTYCNHRSISLPEESSVYSFKKEDVEGVLLIKMI